MDKCKFLLWTLLLCVCTINEIWSQFCNEKIPLNVVRDKIRYNDRFKIELSGNPDQYVPNERYEVKLVSIYDELLDEGPTHSFVEFTFTLKPKLASDKNPGSFILHPDGLSAFSSSCPDNVLQTSRVPKSEVKVHWIAPPSGSGCVLIQAMVVESREEWFSDDGELTKELCEKEMEENELPPVLNHCKACSEAKYEMAFQGLWLKNTHPKDFPRDLFKTAFSDIIGASHAKGHSFWKLSASDELKLLAEEGDVSGIEDILKEQMGDTVHTIIQAHGLRYPDIKSKTYTVFRVDPKNHLVTLVTKIIPSPDWFLGVKDFELCQEDGTWVESRIYDLYPWDAGTKAGYSYLDGDMFPGQKTMAFIFQITSNNPNDIRSPFYDEEGAKMKPLGRLYLTRLKVYDKTCADFSEEETEEEEDEKVSDPRCEPEEWGDWTSCAGKCWQYRYRELKNPEYHEMCEDQVKLSKIRKCNTADKECLTNEPEEENDEDAAPPAAEKDERCKLEEPGPWSRCSVRCGIGTRTRDKKFKHPQYASTCRNNDPKYLQENEDCPGYGKKCSADESEMRILCVGKKWGPWTECDCRTKEKIRYVEKNRYFDENKVYEEQNCARDIQFETVDCSEECEGRFNEIPPQAQSNSTPYGKVKDCKVVWTSSPCIPRNNRRCGKGFRTEEAQIMKHARNGGKPCPKELKIQTECFVDCGTAPRRKNGNILDPTWGPPELDVDCEYGNWGKWTPCTKTCGLNAEQMRFRNIIRNSQGNGEPCSDHKRKETRKCRLPLPCPLKNY